MTRYRRRKFKGGYYFFTVVTHLRQPFLTDDAARACLRNSWRRVRENRPFEVIALCLLPDHLHCIWKLPPDDDDYSTRWSLMKKGFTIAYLAQGGHEYAQSGSRVAKRRRGIWQRRFWERQVRNESELQRHVDYIHYNPVKHRLVEKVEHWPWSTYHKYVQTGRFDVTRFRAMQEDLDNIIVGE